MGLQFIMGPSGSGKSHYLYQKITEEAYEHPECNYLVVVPEQFTMQTQKDLVMANPRRGIMNVDVLSFGRLAHRVFEDQGGLKQTVLDDVSKNFVLRKVAGDCEDQLHVFRNNLKKTGYISEMKSVISEFTQYDIREEEMEQMCSRTDLPWNLRFKLQDVQLIYQKFREYLADRYITGEEMLDVLCQYVSSVEFLRGSTVVLDGFTGFTPVQNRLIGELLSVCERVVVSVTIDSRENPYSYAHPYQLFALSKQMVTSLIDIAKEKGCEVAETIRLFDKPAWRFRDNEAIGFLEENLFRYKRGQYEKEQDALQLIGLKNPKEEVDYVAQQIRSLVREHNYRYRDVAVVASDLNVYGSSIEKIFGQYDIPVFIDHKRSVLLNSFVEYVRSLLAMVANQFSYESVFRYLRTGFTGFTQDEVDYVENYCIARGLRGYVKWNQPWVHQTREVDEEGLVRVNAIRIHFVEQLDGVLCVLRKKSKTVREITSALCDFFVREQIQAKVEQEAKQFGERGELVLEKEYNQIYGIMLELFDKFVELLGDEKISLKDYCDLLDAGLQEAKVGVIPPGIDQVVAGDLERTRVAKVKAVFLLGANDTYLPGSSQGAGILSEHDRELIRKSGSALSPGLKEKIFIQKYYLYLLLTKPSEFVYITLSKVSTDGKTLRPSYLVQELEQLYVGLSVQMPSQSFSQCEMTPKSGFSYLVKGLQKKQNGLDAAWQELYTWYRRQPEWKEKLERIVDAAFYEKPKDELTEKTAKKLYGTILENSVTRLEKFASCAYAHFLAYGLHLNNREEHTFQPVDWGNMFHKAIEYYAKSIAQIGSTWTSVTHELRDELIEKSVEQSVAEYGNTALYSTKRDEYMIERLKRMMKRTVWALTTQLSRGDFEPKGYEVVFGGSSGLSTSNLDLDGKGCIQLRGIIDRVDLCEDDDHVYVKVIDYKTGKKTFDLGELYYGLQLQLILYLSTAMEMEEQLTEKSVVPAGIFYYQMKDPILESGNEDLSQRFEQQLKTLRPDGIVNDDENVVAHMDRFFEKNSVVIPVGRLKNGGFSKTSKVVTQEEFDMLATYAKRQMQHMGSKILQGQAEVSPYALGDSSGCDYCPYHTVCGFEEKLPGYEYRVLEKLKKEDVLDKIRRGEDAWE